MKITIVGSTGNISSYLTKLLVAKAHTVTLISHNTDKEKAIRDLGAIPAIGSIEDVAFLTKAFTGAEAVYTMVPPLFNAGNYRNKVREIAHHLAQAVQQAGVKYVVNLSGVGAHAPEGNGMSSAFYFAEKELFQVPDIHLLHLRAGMFYTNFFGNIPMIKHMKIVGNNFSDQSTVVLVHPHDIAEAAAEALDQLNFTGKEIRYVASDEKTGAQIAAILGKAIGNPALPWVAFSDEDLMKGVQQNGFSEHMASLFAEVGRSIGAGTMFAHFYQNKPTVLGKRSFEQFANGEFAAAYQQQ